MNKQGEESGDDDLKTLIYVGKKPDSSFPWGGYHITITGRHSLPVAVTIEIARKAATAAFPLIHKSHDDRMRRYWKIDKETIRAVEKQPDGLYMVFLQSEQLDAFGSHLKDISEGKLTNIKFNWHISMHSTCEEDVWRTLNHWVTEDTDWDIYVNHWNNRTKEPQWFDVLEDSEPTASCN